VANHRLYEEFENGTWLREVYVDELSRRVAERVLGRETVLDPVEGVHGVSLLAVRLQVPETGPDGWAERLDSALEEVRGILSRHGAVRGGELGSGLIGLFGLPFAGDRDAWRAVLAAVDLLKHFSGSGSAGVSAGVATGPVLVRSTTGDPGLALAGEAWDRALVLLQAGRAGQILVDEETLKRVEKRVQALRLVLAHGVHKELTVYGIKGLRPQGRGNR